MTSNDTNTKGNTMNATGSNVVRIGYEWRIFEKATGRTVTTGIIKISASSAWQTHEGLLNSARSRLRNGRIYRQEIVRHWIEE